MQSIQFIFLDSPGLPLNSCSTTNYIFVGVIIFLCIVIVILVIAFITAIFRIRRKNKSSTKPTEDNFDTLVDIQKPANDVVNPGNVPLKQNHAYGEVNRTEQSEDSESNSDYDDICEIFHHTDDATIQRDLLSDSIDAPPRTDQIPKYDNIVAVGARYVSRP